MLCHSCRFSYTDTMEFNIIKQRHSVRSFTDEAISHDDIKTIGNLINDANVKENLSITLVTNEADAFGKSIMARYGNFKNVRNYICMVGPDTRDAAIKLGYHGEIIVLKAQETGLNTCWVGMTFKKSKIPVEIPKGQKLHAVIAIGHGTTQGVAHKTKSPEQISPDYATAPEWFRRGIDSVVLAPSAVNAQNIRFRLIGDHHVKIETVFHLAARSYNAIDSGIAMAHFQIVNSGIINWEM